MTCLGRFCQPVGTLWGVVQAKVTRSLKCWNTLTRRANNKCDSRSLFFQDQNQDFLLRKSSIATYSAAADSFQRLLAY